MFAGFDGGGTKTWCVVTDSSGSILGTGRAGPSNFHNVGLEPALAAIRSSLEGALGRAGVRGGRRTIIHACLGLAGLDSAKDMKTMTAAVRSMGLASRLMVVNDWRVALAGAFIRDPGVVLIAGTGCVAAGQDSRGRVVRVGGWGNIVDDRGSAYDIGREGLYAAMRASDGRGPETQLLGMIMRRLKAKRPEGIIASVYDGMTVEEVASLSRVVARAAAAGDEVAKRILAEKAGILGELVVTVASRLGLDDPKISFNGGVFAAGEALLVPLEGTIHASIPSARMVEPLLPPPCGAALLSMAKDGAPVGRASMAMMASIAKGGVQPIRRHSMRSATSWFF